MRGPLVAGAFEPDLSGLFVPVFIRTAGVGDLIRGHGRITHEDAFVVGAISAQDLPRRGLGVPTAAVVAPHAFVEAIVEVEVFKVL